ncbi:MAG: hypothetical protein M1836_007470 [Candelina mexicana]|nr:MAG: hypothetical protein M1836_007470 [Candelina mexicana]
MSAAKTKAQGIIDENAPLPTLSSDNAVKRIKLRNHELKKLRVFRDQTAVFSKSYCPYCRASKQLLSENGAKYFLIELDQVATLFPPPSPLPLPPQNLHVPILNPSPPPDDGAALQDALQDITGQRSVPNIFIAQQHIGGNSDLQAKKAELPQLLKDAGAV